MWKSKEQNIEETFIGKSYDVIFEYEGDIRVMKNRWGNPEIITSCGCTLATLDTKKKQLKVKFSPSKLPVHLKKNGVTSYETTKKITIKYVDLSDDTEHEDTLKFTTTVKKQ